MKLSSRREFLKQTTAGIASAASVQLARAEKISNTPRSGPLKLAIVGTGQISMRYLKSASSNSRVRFVATCARTVESAKERAVEFGIGAWYDDYTAMYDAVKPDAVVIATPTGVHAGPTIAALERGIHVLCEKPMAANFEECRGMVAAAHKSGAMLLALPYEGRSVVLAALEYLNEETLGVFTGAEANLSLPGLSRDNWVYDIKAAGGGATLETLVYAVSKLINLLGPARRVTGFINTLIPHRILGDGETIDVLPPPRDPRNAKTIKPTVDDNVTLLIEWANGQQGVARTLWGTSFFNDSAVIYGRHGTLWTGVLGGDVIIHSPEREIPGAEPVTWNAQKSCYKVPIKQVHNVSLLDHFVDCIDGLAQPMCGGQQALHVHEILFKGYEAARSARVQGLETTFTPWHSIQAKFMDTRSGPI